MDCLHQLNGCSSHPDKQSENCRKRQRPTEEEEPGVNGLIKECKKTKRKKRSEERENRKGDTKQTSGDERNKKSEVKSSGKMKRKKAEDSGPTATPKPINSTKKIPSIDEPVRNTKKKPLVAQTKMQKTPSSDSSSSSEEDEASEQAATKTLSSTPVVSKKPPNTKPTKTKMNPPSSSSETDSSPDSTPKKQCLTSATLKSRASQQTNSVQKEVSSAVVGSNPTDREEIKLAIPQPARQDGRRLGSTSSWLGHGQETTRRGGGPGERGRGGGRGSIRGNSGNVEFSYPTDALTNISVVLQVCLHVSV